MIKRAVKPISLPSHITLSVDIGGTGIKMMELDEAGKPVTDRIRALTQRTPRRSAC